jgi:aspartyl-tRNA(Asn)/glutamyl-tRNA(Gln) amidotransferase subunit B
MDQPSKDFQTVIGLEVHVQLNTRRKLFATEGFSFGEPANQQVSPLTMAHPGALPYLNSECLRSAIRMGLATHCTIAASSRFARKNYFYPDLPKGYQLSQDQQPVCTDGRLRIRLQDGGSRDIRIERIHLEEDAGKSVHEIDPDASLIDLNRAGVPLIEIVSRPDLESPEEAAAYLSEVRRIVRYLGISDGDMEKGSLRCDVNVSLKRPEAAELGTRVEIKNINSINFVARSLEYEIARQAGHLAAGEPVLRETRLWNAEGGMTFVMREKEESDDYRYFPEPDLLPLEISPAMIEEIRLSLPVLPEALYDKYAAEGIGHQEVMTLTERIETAAYMEALLATGLEARLASNWLLGPVRAWLNDRGEEIDAFPVSAGRLAVLIRLAASEKLSYTAARDSVLPLLAQGDPRDPETIASALDLFLDSDSAALDLRMDALMEEYPDEVARYRKGKKGLAGFFVGHLMREWKGKGNPRTINEVVQRKLSGSTD